MHVIEWVGEDVLQMPVGALFRDGSNWAAFRLTDQDRAEPVQLEIDRRTALEAEVLGGLEAGDRVILYPGDRIEQGMRVIDRSLM